MIIPLVKGDRKSNLDYRDNLPVNMTVVAREVEGDKGYLLAHDGLTEFASTSGVARGGVFNERLNRHLRVSADQLEEVDTNGNVTVIGSISGSSQCSFAESGRSQAILSDGRYYLYDGYTLKQVFDPELGVPIDITWFNNIYVMTDGEYLFHTDVANEESISPLKYTSSEFGADPIKAVIRTDSNQIVAFNRFSTEMFYFNANAPTGTSVLQRIEGASSTVGIVGTHCKASLDGSVYILGGRQKETPSIHMVVAGGSQSIATREIDKIIGQYSESQLQDVHIESRVIYRDKFLIVHLPNETLLYNKTVADAAGNSVAWSYVKTGKDSPWRAKFGVFDSRIGLWIYGDTQENKLAYLDSQSFAQYGEAQEALFYTPFVPANFMSIDKIELDVIAGFQANDFNSAFSMSYDGVTWGQEYWNKISLPDNYNSRYIIRRLGYVKKSVALRFRFISSDKMAFSRLDVNAS